MRSSLRQHPAFGHVGQFAQCIGVWVNGWLVVSAYAHPNPVAPGELGALLLDAFVSNHIPSSQPWFVCGDMNQVIGSSDLENCLTLFGGVALSTDRPTRWEGHMQLFGLACH